MDEYTAPEFDRSALVTIDTQQCTLDGEPFAVPGTTEVIPKISALTAAFRAARRPIIHVIRLYHPNGSNAERCRRKQLLAGAELALLGSKGRMPVSDILPPGVADLDDDRLLGGDMLDVGLVEWVMYKPRWGAFYRTRLEDHLQDLDVSTLVLCGCNYPNCPRTTLYEGSERDFRLAAISDAISGLTAEGAAELRGIGVSLIDTESCIESLHRSGTGPAERRG
jgi:nicotinamidase-related amidase